MADGFPKIAGMSCSIYLFHFLLLAAFSIKLTPHLIVPGDSLGSLVIQFPTMGFPVLVDCALNYTWVERSFIG